jgi:hypothetical protein
MRRFLMLTIATLLPLVATAAVDMYMQFKDTKDTKGEGRVVRCSDGACVVDHLAPGSYSVLVCDAQGKVIPGDTKLEYTTVSPRDLATGQASGKRMHKPITISSRVAGPPAASPGNVIAIDEPGVQLVIGVSAAAVDAASAKVTKTRSNIQNN